MMSNLQRFLLRLMLWLGPIAYLSLAHAAGVPPLINYQGTLTDAYGVPIPDATKAMEFNIYDAPTGGNLIWGPQLFNTVPIINGRFNVILGTTDSLGRSIANAFNAENRYLGIRAGSLTELAPRQQILTTAYAIRSLNAVNAVSAVSANTALNGVPIGTILAWHKNMPNTPALPFGFVECNGQVLNDAASPYNAKTMPNLNGEGRFLRGASQSGVSQAMDWKSLNINSLSAGYSYTHGPILIPKTDYNAVGLFGGKWEGPGNGLFFKFDDSEVRPINMSVVWIMRVK